LKQEFPSNEKIIPLFFLSVICLQTHQLAPIDFGIYGVYQSDKIKYTVFNPTPKPGFTHFIKEATKQTNGYRVGGFIESTPWNFYLFADGSYAHFGNQTYKVSNDFPNIPPNFLNGKYNTRASGNLYQVAGEIGYMFLMTPKLNWKWFITPKAGYGYDHHVLKRQDTPTNIFNDLPIAPFFLPATMRIAFNEKLKWDWYGPYLGVKMTFIPIEQFIHRCSIFLSLVICKTNSGSKFFDDKWCYWTCHHFFIQSLYCKDKPCSWTYGKIKIHLGDHGQLENRSARPISILLARDKKCQISAGVSHH